MLSPFNVPNHRVAHQSQHTAASMGSLFAPQPDSLVRVGGRRWFLQVGLGGMAGLSLPGLLQARAAAAESGKPARPSPKSVILVWLSGGPSQIDMWDMKPEMPENIRGPFQPIATSVPGIQICEHLPNQAAMMDKFAIIRSMDANGSNHWSVTFQSGSRRPVPNTTSENSYPSMGSVAAKFRGANQPDVPAFVGMGHRYDVHGAGPLGHQYEPIDSVRVQGRFAMPQGVSVPRLQDRDHLRRAFDGIRTQRDLGYLSHDRYTQEAFDLVTGGAAERAFDISKEPLALRERYGRGSMGEKALLARRLVEAGVTFVVMSDSLGVWDNHGDDSPMRGIVKGLKPLLPHTDHVVTTLVDDLDQRGLLDTTLVLVLGEFGRAEVMSRTAGREHGLMVMSLLVAGGGIRGGQVIGATDRRGGSIKDRHFGPGDLAATVFRHLGIDPGNHWINPSGRPVPLVEEGQPIAELM